MEPVKRKKAKIIRYVRYHKDKDPENHYREQLMLYTPWRKEHIDLIKDCQTYQERFEQVKDEVISNTPYSKMAAVSDELGRVT